MSVWPGTIQAIYKFADGAMVIGTITNGKEEGEGAITAPRPRPSLSNGELCSQLRGGDPAGVGVRGETQEDGAEGRNMMMRWKGGRVGFSLTCLFMHCALGGLPAPQNVALISKNFSLFLTWVPEEYPLEIVYIVKIKRNNDWIPFPNCTNPSGEGCDVTCTIESCYKDYQAKVGSNASGHQITWSQSRSFIPFRKMELGAPQVKVVLKEESVFVHLDVKLAACKEKVLKACLLDNLSYEVEYWNTVDHKRTKLYSTEKVIEIRKDRLICSNNCVNARSVYTSTLRKGNFSEPVCFNIKTDGSCALAELPKPFQVLFNSSNFNYMLHWMCQGPEESIFDVEYQIYGDVWKSKPECYHISARCCDLTNEITQENNWYYARVKTVWKNQNSSWSMSERFCPLDKTIVGAPEVKYAVSVRSIAIWVKPPRGGLHHSIEDIFSLVEYKVQLSQPAANKLVCLVSNESGNFTIESLEPNTEYCGTVKLHLKAGFFSKESQTAEFCSRTDQDWTLMDILLATGLILLGVFIVGTFIWMVHSYTQFHRTLPRALDLDPILLKKYSSLKPPAFAPHFTNSHKDVFQFEQSVHMERLGLLKCHSRDAEEILKPGEHGLATLLCTYTPQHHTRITPASGNCGVPSDNECSSPYRPQGNGGLSNTNHSREQAETYGAFLQMVSPNPTEWEIDGVRGSFAITLNGPLQMVRDEVSYNNECLLWCKGPGMEMQLLKLMEGQPIPFLANQGDKPQTHQTDGKEKQPTLLTLKEESPISLYRAQVKTQSLLSLLKYKDDVSFVLCAGRDEQPPSTEVSLNDGYLPKPWLCDELTDMVKLNWENECEVQPLTLHSSQREGQHQDSPTSTAAESSQLLAGWELCIYMDE
ncbi:uncharacterized protein [Narcine bancroftii]|uniref:uncharacterized protein n=1 Tax=Narcine bancroftii TaxID=1343680 RepID=UPI0038311768